MIAANLLATASLTAAAASPAPSGPVERLASTLDAEYPIAAVAERYAAALRANARGRRYDRLAGCDLAKRLEADLQTVHRDLHLRVDCTPAPAPTASKGPDHPTEEAEWNGNPRFFYVASFSGWPLSEDACRQAVASMAVGAGAHHIVVDVRGNGGGAGIIGDLIASYFFPLEDAHPLVRGRFRDPRRDVLDNSYPYVPGPRFPDAKVYILVNKDTGSAAEGFAFGLQRAGRATVVGQMTAGAGIAAHPIDLGNGLSASIPVKLLLALDGSPGWEGVGVEPDVVTAPGKEIETVTALIAADLARHPG